MIYPFSQLEEQYNKIPEDLQQAISSADIAQKIQNIADKYKLQLDEADELFEETTLVMFGLTHPDSYVQNLKNRLKLPEDTVNSIAKDINEQVFMQIRESLKMVHQSAIKINTPGGQESSEGNVTEENIDREQLLREVENPTPRSQKDNVLLKTMKVTEMEEKQYVEKNNTETPTTERSDLLKRIENYERRPQINNELPKKEEILVPEVAPKISIQREIPKEIIIEPGKSIIEEKTKNPVVIPREKVEIKEKKIDPYREPLE